MYPAVYSYLLSQKAKLSERNKSETGIRYEWYALQRWGSNYWDDFFEQNITWQRITHENTFCLTREGMVVLDSMAFINGAKEKTYYLLAVLNSKLIKFWMKKNVPEYGSTGFRLSNQFVSILPIPRNVPNQHIIDGLVTEQLNGIERIDEINDYVNSLYGLSKEEISYINTEII